MSGTDLVAVMPQELAHLKLQACRAAKGASSTPIEFVRYPLDNNSQSEDDRGLLRIWRAWWDNTTYAQDMASTPPKWNNPARTGEIWTKYGEAAELTCGRPLVFCLNCGMTLQHPAVGSIGTKHLGKHLVSRLCAQTTTPVHNRPNTQESQPLRKRKTTGGIPAFSDDAYRTQLVRVFMDNNWSFRTVERPSFQEFVQFLRPGVERVTRYKFRKFFLAEYEVAQASVLSSLGQGTKMSIALDAWSANNHLSFLAIKAYYISADWTLREELLDFLPLRGSHTGFAMAAQVVEVLERTGTKGQLLAITCDNASNNNTLTRSVQACLQEEGITWDSQENTIPCLAHIINLVVQDIIAHLKLEPPEEVDANRPLQRRQVEEIGDHISVPNSLRKLRALCIAIDRTSQRYERFLDTQVSVPVKQRLSVIQDVKTRWNSTYDMCERAVKLRKYIDQWLEEEIALKSSASGSGDSSQGISFRDLRKLSLSAFEWRHLEQITTLLGKFKRATEYISQNQKPMVQYVWRMYNNLFDFLESMTVELGDADELEVADELGRRSDWPAVVQAAAQRGRDKLAKYYSKTDASRGYLYNCATVLDPRQKLTTYDDPAWERGSKQLYRAQFLDYLDRYDSQEDLATSQTTIDTRWAPEDEWLRRPIARSQDSLPSSQSQARAEQDSEQRKGPTRREGEIYLSTPPVEDEGASYDILTWWKRNEAHYPRLARVARDVLSVQITEVGVERVFNVAGEVIEDRRHNLAPQTLQKIMILKDSLCGGRSVSTAGASVVSDEDESIYELMSQLELEESVPWQARDMLFAEDEPQSVPEGHHRASGPYHVYDA